MVERARRAHRVPAAPRATTSRRARTRSRSSRTRASRSTSWSASRPRRSSPPGTPGRPRTRALFRAILLPLLVRTAEACGGFDWEDGAFDRVYGELEHSLFGTNRAVRARSRRSSASRSASRSTLARGIRVHETTADEICARWPEARELLPSGFGQTPERTCVLALERELPGGEESPPDAPGRAGRRRHRAPARHGRAGRRRAGRLRAARPHPLEVRPLLGIAATEPAGEPTRLDPWRGKLAADLLARLAESEDDAELGEALERWELVAVRVRAAPLGAAARGARRAARRRGRALGGGDAGGHPRRRARPGARGGSSAAFARSRAARPLDPGAADVLRRAFVEAILHDDRDRLLAALDDALLGLRARPPGYFSRVRRRIRHGRVTFRAATIERWRRPGACWPGSSGSRRSTGSDALPGDLLDELRALLAEAEAWARAERTVPEDDGSTPCERCRNALRDSSRTLLA